MLGIGEVAPEFSGVTGEGVPFRLSDLRGRPSILFFYPKASSPGCTVEARGFSDHYREFSEAGIAVVGISVDSVAAQHRFRDSCDLPYPLVADPTKAIATAYGVVGLFGLAKRVTFFLDADLRVVDRVEGMLPGPHVRRALERLSPGRSDPGTATSTGARETV